MIAQLIIAGLAAAAIKNATKEAENTEKSEQQSNNGSGVLKTLVALGAASAVAGALGGLSEQNRLGKMQSDTFKSNLAGMAASNGIDPSFLK